MQRKFTGVVVERGAIGNGFRVDIDGVQMPAQSVPVLIEYDHNRVAGEANVYMEESALKATILLSEPLLPGLEGMMFPCLQFRVDDKDTRRDGEVLVLERTQIISLGLCANNVDPNIKPIGINDFAERPPLGAMPKWRWDELHPSPTNEDIVARIKELQGAIGRYAHIREENADLIKRWFDEKDELSKKL